MKIPVWLTSQNSTLNLQLMKAAAECTPCRIGTKKLLDYLTKITDGKGEIEDLDKIQELANHMKSSSLCALGQTAANPILSTMNAFGDEYLAHIKDKKCPAGVCKSSFILLPLMLINAADVHFAQETAL